MSNEMPQMNGMPTMAPAASTVEEKQPVEAQNVENEGLVPPLHEEAPTNEPTPSEDIISKPKYETHETTISNSVGTLPSPKNGIEVVAMRKGFYNNMRIKEGDTFRIRKIEECGSWMKCVDPAFEKARVKHLEVKKEKRKARV